jgi:hypothetical protein
LQEVKKFLRVVCNLLFKNKNAGLNKLAIVSPTLNNSISFKQSIKTQFQIKLVLSFEPGRLLELYPLSIFPRGSIDKSPID